jgi:hypothetical protein
MFVTSSGHLPAQFAHACERGNYPAAAALARQLRPLSVVEALSLLPLIAEHEPAKFDAAAVRWHARWSREQPGVDLARAALALAALAVLKGPRRAEGLKVLRSLV